MSNATPTALLLAALVFAAAPPPAGAQPCTGDCDELGVVRLVDLILAVRVALGEAPPEDCGAGDADGDLAVRVDELVAAVGHHLTACPAPAPPTDTAALLAWLQAGNYLGWHAESAIHGSAGPHFGRVRTFVNDAAFDSLAAGDATHPKGAALVKELYGSSADVVGGWSVMIKTQDDSAGGDGWYWLERFGSSTIAAGNGVALCYGCHGNDYRGLETRDYVLTPFPLQ